MSELDEEVVEPVERELVVGTVEAVEEEQHHRHPLDERRVRKGLALVRRCAVTGRQHAFGDHVVGVPRPPGRRNVGESRRPK